MYIQSVPSQGGERETETKNFVRIERENTIYVQHVELAGRAIKI